MKKLPLVLICVFALLMGALLYAEQTAPAPGGDGSVSSSAQPETPAPGGSQQPASPAPVEPLAWLVGVEDLTPANEELQNYLPKQVLTKGNTLFLTAEKTADGGYVSGKAESNYAFRYGEFSFRVPTMRGAGLFPALWMLPAHDRSYPEIDLYELIGSRPHEIYGVLHYQEGGRHYFQHRFKQNAVPDAMVLDFTWTPEKLTWSVDGTEVYSVDQNVPSEPMYFIANLAIGGTWPGAPDQNTRFPATFALDVLKFEPVETFTR